MPFDVLSFLVNQTVAKNQGISDQRATQLGLVGGMLTLGLASNLLVTRAIAQREAPSAVPADSGALPGDKTSAELVVVPDITNNSIDDATSFLQVYGLKGVEGKPTMTIAVKKGLVASQSPAPGECVALGSSVTLFPSNGLFIMPNLKGWTLEQAEALWSKLQLEPRNLVLGKVVVVDSSDQVDKIILHEPKADELIAENDIVVLHVGSRREVKQNVSRTD